MAQRDDDHCPYLDSHPPALLVPCAAEYPWTPHPSSHFKNADGNTPAAELEAAAFTSFHSLTKRALEVVNKPDDQQADFSLASFRGQKKYFAAHQEYMKMRMTGDKVLHSSYSLVCTYFLLDLLPHRISQRPR